MLAWLHAHCAEHLDPELLSVVEDSLSTPNVGGSHAETLMRHHRTITTLEGDWKATRMDKTDLKAERKNLYRPPAGRFVEVVVPEMTFLAVDGHGNPDTSQDYRHAVEALFSHFLRSEVPKNGYPPCRCSAATLTEGLCVQTLHVGTYDDEAPLLRELHRRYPPARGMAPTGRHHEIYLNDARKAPPARLKVVLTKAARRRRSSTVSLDGSCQRCFRCRKRAQTFSHRDLGHATNVAPPERMPLPCPSRTLPRQTVTISTRCPIPERSAAFRV